MPNLRAYAELLRVSNSLTAVADVWLGVIVVRGSLAPASESLLLTVASFLLYHGGMVLNDVAHASRDAADRPERPIPSGRISRAFAAKLAAVLLVGGVALAGLAAWLVGGVAPLVVAVCLVAAICVYNFTNKDSFGAAWLMPWNMGICRAFNVGLGLSVGSTSDVSAVWFGAAIMPGTLFYIAGVTYFAQNESQTSRRRLLLLAMLLCLVGFYWFAAAPIDLGLLEKAGHTSHGRWILLWIIVALFVFRRFAAAILQPTPKYVQRTIGHALQSIIIIDAALAFGYAGPYWMLAIFALYPPTVLAAKFVAQT